MGYAKIAMLFAAAILLAPIGGARAAKLHEAGIPEYFMTNPNAPHCMVQFNIAYPDRSERRRALFQFIDEEFKSTAKWKQKFSLLGVDYVDFRYFHLIFFKGCNNGSTVIGETLRFQGKISDDVDLVSTFQERLKFASPEMLFRRFGSTYSLASCTVKLTERFNPTDTWDSAYQEMKSIWQKYRFPIADIEKVNEDIYVIYSRQCGAKRTMYNEMVQLMKAGTNKISPSAFTANFSPDVTILLRLHEN